MNFSNSRNRRTAAEISLTPLIDLFLNILVFFLVTTSFAATSVFFVDLPEATPGKAMADRKQLSISVGARGEIALDREAINLEQLKTRLSEIPIEKRPALPVILRADRGALHGSVVEVIDTIRQVGLENIGIATEQPRER